MAKQKSEGHNNLHSVGIAVLCSTKEIASAIEKNSLYYEFSESNLKSKNQVMHRIYL